MGNLFTKPLCTLLVRFLRSQLDDTTESACILQEGEFLFHINKNPGRENNPQFWLLMQKCTLVFGVGIELEANPFRFRVSTVAFEIGRIILKCEELDLCIRIRGRITLCDVFTTVYFRTKFNKGFQVSDLDAIFEVSKIKPQLVVIVNNTNHSRLGNLLLNINDPVVASNILNAIFMLSKNKILTYLNYFIEELLKSNRT